MALRLYNDFVSRAAAGFWMSQPFWAELQAAATTPLLGGNTFPIHSAGDSKALPNPLPSGVTAYILTGLSCHSQGANSNGLLTAKLINLGSLDISTPTFTDANAMPSSTELNTASQQAASGVLVEVTTALNATPGNISVTYKNQAGTGGQTSPSQALIASAALRTVGWLNLASGDWGVQDITAATRTGGTTPTGVVKFWGVIPIAFSHLCPIGANEVNTVENMLSTMVNPIRLGVGDKIGCFLFGSNVVKATAGEFFFVGDN